MQSLNYGIVIATFSRPDELRQTLFSLLKQTHLPKIVVVVDSSPAGTRDTVKDVCAEAASTLPIRYIHSSVASSTTQRNIGVQALGEHGVDYVQILDDDTSPAVDYVERLLKLLNQNDSAIGASGVTKPTPPKPTLIQGFARLLAVIVGLESYRGGVISLAGCGIPVWRRASKVQKVEWLFGCSLWKIKIFSALEYNPRLVGAALAEDLHFSLLASRQGDLLVDPGAHLFHSYSQVERPNQVLFAYRFARNRWFVVRDMPHQWISIPFYVVSNLALSFASAFSAIRSGRRNNLEVARSYLLGMLDAWRDREPR